MSGREKARGLPAQSVGSCCRLFVCLLSWVVALKGGVMGRCSGRSRGLSGADARHVGENTILLIKY